MRYLTDEEDAWRKQVRHAILRPLGFQWLDFSFPQLNGTVTNNTTDMDEKRESPNAALDAAQAQDYTSMAARERENQLRHLFGTVGYERMRFDTVPLDKKHDKVILMRIRFAKEINEVQALADLIKMPQVNRWCSMAITSLEQAADSYAKAMTAY